MAVKLLRWNWRLVVFTLALLLCTIYTSILDYPAASVRAPSLITPPFRSWSYLPSASDTCADLPSTYTRRGSYFHTISREEILRHRADWKAFMATVGPVPQVAGRGAIYCVYPKAIEQALLSIQFLLASGWSNPIEVWHKNELDAHQISALEKIGATVHNLSNYMVVAVKDQPKLSSGNAAQYEIKGLALLYTTLDEILFLDCDNIPIADPSVLFESDAYLETNALFWKDFWKTYPQNPIWQILDIPCTNEFEQESGQLVFKKSNPSVWRALNLAVYMQTHQELYFDLLLGDKDTFRLAWRALDIPYHMVRPHLAVLGYEYLGFFYGHSMVQYAPFWSEFDNGPAPGNHVDTESPKVMFVHANIMKHIGYSPGVSFSLLLHYKNAVTPEAHGSIVAAPTLLFKGTTTLGEYWFNGVLQETQKSNFTEMFPKFDADYQRYNEIAHQYVL